MILIDVKGPDGNIFVILGIFSNIAREKKKRGEDITEYQELIATFQSMSYDEILDRIEEICDEIMFIGR